MKCYLTFWIIILNNFILINFLKYQYQNVAYVEPQRIIGSLAKKFILSNGDLTVLGSLIANNQHSNAILEKNFLWKNVILISMIVFNILKYSIDLILLLFGKLELQMGNSLRLFLSQTALYAMTGLYTEIEHCFNFVW